MLCWGKLGRRLNSAPLWLRLDEFGKNEEKIYFCMNLSGIFLPGNIEYAAFKFTLPKFVCVR